MASGTIPKVVHGLGTVASNQAFPFTAPSNGIICFSFKASSSSTNSYLYLQCDGIGNNNIFQAASMGGAAINNQLVVKKGWKISVDHTANATFNWLYFVPFE